MKPGRQSGDNRLQCVICGALFHCDISYRGQEVFCDVHTSRIMDQYRL
jgi:hypothetical protein